MAGAEGFWNELFGAGGGPGAAVHLRLLRKQGQPFLALPAGGRAAAAALGLYPAQTGRARAARAVLRWLLLAGAAVGTESISLRVSPGDPFAEFLCSLAGAGRGAVPGFGILAGNPASPGQRFIVLVFDAHQRPVAVVKAGLSEPARGLVRKEQSFLEAVAGKAGVPKLRGTFQSSRLEALALDYFAGQAPRPRDDWALPALLWPWVDGQRTVSLGEVPAWGRLEGAAGGSPLWPVVAGRLRARALHPALAHGDLAPWNIKLSPQGHWRVLDWERGEVTGIAGWDWFHYLIQRAILVERRPTRELAGRVEGLLNSEPFQRYAAHAGLRGCERELVLAYLLYSAEVIKPAEGLPQTRDLVSALGGTLKRLKP
ncbi:MAG: hypothetical protein ABSF95_16100 [Verrucomicrobiota bacterium]|jgi:hypothetical protein